MECVSHEAERPRSRYDVEVLQSNVPLALQSHACYNFEPLLLPKMSKFKAFMHLATLFFMFCGMKKSQEKALCGGH